MRAMHCSVPIRVGVASVTMALWVAGLSLSAPAAPTSQAPPAARPADVFTFLHKHWSGGLDRVPPEADLARLVAFYRENPQDPEALWWMAYLSGLGVVQLDRPFEVVVQEAVDHGNTLAMALLGRLYLTGESGMHRDSTRGLELIRRAHERAEPEAAYQLALAYINGLGGLAKDPEIGR